MAGQSEPIKEGIVIPFSPPHDRWVEKPVVAETASRDYERGFNDGLRMGFKCAQYVKKRLAK